VEAVPGRWGGRTQTWACRQDVQPRQSGKVSSQGVALSGGEVFRERGGAVRAHAGGGTFGGRGRAGGGRGDLAALDVTGGFMDAAAKTQSLFAIGESASVTLANWCNWMAAFMTGWQGEVRRAV